MSIEISPNGVHLDALTDGSQRPVLRLRGDGQQPAMAHASVDLPLAAEVAWSLMSDLSRLDRWLTIHDEWRSQPPVEVAAGIKVAQQVTLVGWHGTIEWTVQEYTAPSLVRLVGTGLRDEAQVTLELTVEPVGYWSRVIAEMEFSGWAVHGAAGVAMELGATRELESSLQNLERIASA